LTKKYAQLFAKKVKATNISLFIYFLKLNSLGALAPTRIKLGTSFFYPF
jgi:hypothetical protein